MTQQTAAQRDSLAQKHLQASAAQARRGRSPGQRLRLQLLRVAGRLGRSDPASRRPPRRILVIRPDHLGDLLFATPALRLLRSQFPNAHISALAGPWGQPVLAHNPDLDELLTCSFPGFTRRPKSNPLAPYRLLQTEARRLRPRQFDLALILRFDHWWGAWLAAAAGIPQRIGYDLPETRPFLTQPVAYTPGRHEVVQNLGLIQNSEFRILNSELGAPPLQFSIPVEADAALDVLLAAAGANPSHPLVALHPGSGAAVKRWRTGAWVELVNWLIRGRRCQVIFTGSAGETGLIDPILQALPPDLTPAPISLAGQSDLNQLAALYRRCKLVIGPDSGPLHLAVAVDAPTIHLYGPVDSHTFGPWAAPDRHPVLTSEWTCLPCNRLDWPDSTLHEHGCLRDIRVDQVMTEAARLL